MECGSAYPKKTNIPVSSTIVSGLGSTVGPHSELFAKMSLPEVPNRFSLNFYLTKAYNLNLKRYWKTQYGRGEVGLCPKVVFLRYVRNCHPFNVNKD